MDEVRSHYSGAILTPSDWELLRRASKPRYSSDEFARRGEAIYAEKIEPTLTLEDEGKAVAIDIETGEYEIDEDELLASVRLRRRIPDPQIWGVRIGYEAVDSFGPPLVPKRLKR